jgi:hypothetical protein
VRLFLSEIEVRRSQIEVGVHKSSIGLLQPSRELIKGTDIPGFTISDLRTPICARRRGGL